MIESKFFHLFKVDEERQKKVLEQVNENAKPDLDYYLLTIFAGVTITLGLILNNSAVVIGGMLMAPLVWPILALALAMSRGSLRSLERSLLALLKSAVIILIGAYLIGLISPFNEFGSEIFSRTTPTLLELIIAILAGFVAAFVTSYPGLDNFISGVVIAAAVVPPLCVTGLALSAADLQSAAGSLLLFVSNLIAMILAAVLFFFLARFKPLTSEISLERRRSNVIWTVTILFIIAIPLFIITGDVIQKNSRSTIVRNAIIAEVTDAEISEVKIIEQNQVLLIQANIRSKRNLTPLQMEDLTDKLSQGLGRSVNLRMTITPVLEAGRIYENNLPSDNNDFNANIFPTLKDEKK